MKNPCRIFPGACLALLLAIAPVTAESSDPAADAPVTEPQKAAETAASVPIAPAAEPQKSTETDAPAPVPPQAGPPALSSAGVEQGGSDAFLSAFQAPRLSVEGVTIQGDVIEGPDPTTGLITVTGNPRATRGPDEIRATRLVLNPLTRQFTAEGDVIVRQGGREFRATRLTYNFDQQEGQAEGVTTVQNTYYVRAEQMTLLPGGLQEYRRARVTTCDRRHPHYSLFCRKIHVKPEDQLVAEGVGVDVGGFRIVTVPRLTKSLARDDDDERESLYPSFGYDSRNGPYVEKEFRLKESAPVWLRADVRLNSLREPQGGILAATPGHLQFVGTLFYRDNAENQRARHMHVTRIPEVGVVWSSTNDRPRPGRFLPHQIAGVGYPRALDISSRWRLAAELSGGYFRQHRGDDLRGPDSIGKDGARLSFQAQAVLPYVKLGPLSLNGLRLMARQNVYDTGDKFTVFGTGIGKHVRLGKFRVGVDRFDHYTVGSTPFLFDDLELKEEWRPRLEYSTRQFSFSYHARIRGQGGDLYDQEFSVSKLFHCIQPRLTYRVRRQEIFLEIRIPGLSGGGRRRVGESRTKLTGEEDEMPPAPRSPG